MMNRPSARGDGPEYEDEGGDDDGPHYATTAATTFDTIDDVIRTAE